MAVQFNSFAESNVSGTNDTLTNPVSFTNTSGDLLLAALVGDNTTASVSAVYYGGPSGQLTQLFDHRFDANYMWVGYLLSPATGTNDLTFNFTESLTAARIGGITFRGVDLTDPIGGSNSTSRQNELSTTTTISTTVTVQGASGMVVDFLGMVNISAGSADGGQTEKMNNTGGWGRAPTGHIMGISYKAHTGSNTTMGWSLTTISDHDDEHYAIELLPKKFGQAGIMTVL